MEIGRTNGESTARARSAYAGWELRPYRPYDRASVVALLADLPQLYPGADKWLARRLSDVAAQSAYCTIAVSSSGALAGITIEVPKVQGLKLCTLFVASQLRGQGLGRALVDSCEERWRAFGIRRNYVTVRDSREEALSKLLAPHGFEKIAEHRDRYGPGRTEVVLRRSPAVSWPRS